MKRSLHNGKSFSSLETPIGEITLVATNIGISHLYLPNIEFNENVHARKVNNVDGEDTEKEEKIRDKYLIDAISEMKSHFSRQINYFNVPLDLTGMSEFRTKVLTTLREVPYGKTITYKNLAQKSGYPIAIQAVGSVCAKNPLPILIPCHRVIRTTRENGNYAGGKEIKELLLNLEKESLNP